MLDIHVHGIHLCAMKTLAEILSDAGTTDAALAGRVGCDRSMITKIRAGKATPSLPLALAIHRETGVALEFLMPPKPSTPSASAAA